MIATATAAAARCVAWGARCSRLSLFHNATHLVAPPPPPRTALDNLPHYTYLSYCIAIYVKQFSAYNTILR